jgi:hypothetical protein
MLVLGMSNKQFSVACNFCINRRFCLLSQQQQTEIHTAELLVPAPSAFEIEMTTEKLKKTQITKY